MSRVSTCGGDHRGRRQRRRSCLSAIRPLTAAVVALCTLASLTLAPTAHAGKREMEILQTDVDELQRQIYEMKSLVERQSLGIEKLLQSSADSSGMRQLLAEFNANVGMLLGDIRQLTDRVDRIGDRMTSLEEQVARSTSVSYTPSGVGAGGTRDDSAPMGDATSIGGAEPIGGAVPVGGSGPDLADESLPSPTARPATGLPPGMRPANGQPKRPTGVGDAPQDLYNQAYADYLQDSFELARSTFQDFLNRYPRHDLADNAQYWIAMTHFNEGQHSAAVDEFDNLLNRFPDADNASEAMYRKGIALHSLNRLGQAVLVLNDVVSRYPDTPAARLAQERLHELASGEY